MWLVPRVRGSKAVMSSSFGSSAVGGLDAAPAVVSLLALAALRWDEGRPRGGLQVDPAALRVAPSSVPGAGLGVFAQAALPAGSTLGSYPGVIHRQGPAWAERKGNDAVQRAQYFVWSLQNGAVIDPTDRQGNLPEAIMAWPLAPVPTTLCRINEPPPGADVNVDTAEEGNTVTFFTSRPVEPGDELFCDYGKNYDRSAYQSS